MPTSAHNWTSLGLRPWIASLSISDCPQISWKTERVDSDSARAATSIYGSTSAAESPPASSSAPHQRNGWRPSSAILERNALQARSPQNCACDGASRQSEPLSNCNNLSARSSQGAAAAAHIPRPESSRRCGLRSTTNSLTCSGRLTTCFTTVSVLGGGLLSFPSIRSKTEWSSRPSEGVTNGRI